RHVSRLRSYRLQKSTDIKSDLYGSMPEKASNVIIFPDDKTRSCGCKSTADAKTSLVDLYFFYTCNLRVSSENQRYAN
ncbi:MAG: hypothetical protein PVI38_15780, partial [Desulfobacterales bacterium]